MRSPPLMKKRFLTNIIQKLVNFGEKMKKNKLFSSVAFVLISFAALPSSAYAQEAQQPGMLNGFLPIIFIIIFFYLFLIRPQQKKAKEHQQLLNALKKGDEVITAGGIYGTVVNVKDNIVEIKVDTDVNLRVAKTSISTVVLPKTPEIVK